MYRIMCLGITLAVGLAADVTVYGFQNYYYEFEPTPVDKSLPPWKFGWHLHSLHRLAIRITTKNKSPSVTAVKVSYVLDDGTETEVESYIMPGYKRPDEIHYYLGLYKNISREVNIFVKLYKLETLCASLFVAEGRRYSNETTSQTHTDYKDACYDSSVFSCVLEVDLSDQCVDPRLVTEPTTTTTTLKPVTGGNSSNTTITKSTDMNNDKIETTTGKITAIIGTYESNTVPIVSSVSCVAVLLVVIIIFLWKHRWIKCNQSGTPQLLIKEPSDTFYLNMLFRRECDREIADIEQHEYAEIGEHLYEDIQNQYEYIHPEELVADRVTSTSFSDTFPVSEDRPSTRNMSRPLRAEQLSNTHDSGPLATVHHPDYEYECVECVGVA